MDRVKEKKQTELLRNVIQIVFFFILPSAFSSAFAAVKDAASAFSEGAPLSLTPFAKIFLFLLAFTAIFGRFFCGYACAFGTLGDVIYMLSVWIQKKTGKKLPRIPADWVRRLQLVKYLVLALVFILCFMGSSEEVSKNSPWTVFSLLVALKSPAKDLAAGVILLVLILLGMAVQSRFFCQFLCPMGAVFSLMPVFPTGQLYRNEAECIKGCRICERGCPVSLKLGENDLKEGECIRCNKCITACPRGNIGLRHFMFRAADPILVLFQAAVLILVLKFVI